MPKNSSSSFYVTRVDEHLFCGNIPANTADIDRLRGVSEIVSLQDMPQVIKEYAEKKGLR